MSDIFEDVLRRCAAAAAAARGAAPAGASAAPTCATISRSRSRRPSTGKTASVTIPTSVTCEVCSGTGAKAGSKPRHCPTCGGAGRVRAAQGFFSDRAHLPDLPRPRRGHRRSLPDCGGAGRVTRERTLSVNIPAGVEDGTRIRLAGEGEAGLRGGPAGDLYIFLSIKPHPFFQRDGADLFCRVPISMSTAALGGEFDGADASTAQDARVKVPEGTQSGKQFRLRGKGMPVLRSRDLGDLYIQVAVETPQNLTRRQRELLMEFERESSGDTHPESSGFFARVRDFFDGIGGSTRA